MDLVNLANLENALNNGDFKEQVTKSLEGIYNISKVLNQLEILDNFTEHDLKIVETIQTIKSKLAGYENSEQKLKDKIGALVTQIEAKRQKLEQRLNLELEKTTTSEIQKLNEAGNTLKTNLATMITDVLILELGKFRTTAKTLINTPRMQGVNMKFVGFYVIKLSI